MEIGLVTCSTATCKAVRLVSDITAGDNGGWLAVAGWPLRVQGVSPQGGLARDACGGVLVNVSPLLLVLGARGQGRGEALMCSVCWYLWYKHPHQGALQATVRTGS